MNTQTFAQAQNITAINILQILDLQELSDQELLGVTGGLGPHFTHKSLDLQNLKIVATMD